nr:SLATT domain-containing protein [Streptomyces sp. SID5643]
MTAKGDPAPQPTVRRYGGPVDTEDPAGLDSDARRRRAIGAEFRRIEESAMYSAQCQFEETKRWRAVHFLFGVPATLLAAIAGTTALVESTGRIAAGILALISSGLGAVLTTVNAPQRTAQASASANAFLEIQTAARQHREIDLDQWTLDEARQALATLTARRDEQNATAEVPGRRAYRKAQANLRAGTQTYAVDGDT